MTLIDLVLLLGALFIGWLAGYSTAPITPPVIYAKPRFMLHPKSYGVNDPTAFNELMMMYHIEPRYCVAYTDETRSRLTDFIHLFPDETGKYSVEPAFRMYLKGVLPDVLLQA